METLGPILACILTTSQVIRIHIKVCEAAAPNYSTIQKVGLTFFYR